MAKATARRTASNNDGRYERALQALGKLTGNPRPRPRPPEEPASGEDLHRIFVEHCYGDSWADPVLDYKTKSLVTIAVLTAFGIHNELKLHIRLSQNVGVTKDEIVALFKHLAAYTGVPRTVHATTLAREVWRG